MDVAASRSNKTAEVGAMRKMLDRTEERFGVTSDWIAADTAYGSTDNLVWLVLKRQILPFIPVFDKGERTDGTFSRSDFTWDDEHDRYICPGERCGTFGGHTLIPIETRLAGARANTWPEARTAGTAS